MPQFDLKKTTVKFKDGAAEELAIKIAEGELRWVHKKTREFIRDRGILSEVRNGNEEPVELTFNLVWENLKSITGGTETPMDVLRNRGEAADWTTTGAACDPYAIDVEIVYDINCGAEEIETITLEEFRPDKIDFNLQDSTIAVSGRCNRVAVTAVRS